MGRKVVNLGAAIVLVTSMLGGGASYAADVSIIKEEGATVAKTSNDDAAKREKDDAWNRKRKIMACIEKVCDQVYEMIPSPLSGPIENDPYGFGKTILKSELQGLIKFKKSMHDITGENISSPYVLYYPYDLDLDGFQDFIIGLPSLDGSRDYKYSVLMYDSNKSSFNYYDGDLPYNSGLFSAARCGDSVKKIYVSYIFDEKIVMNSYDKNGVTKNYRDKCVLK